MANDERITRTHEGSRVTFTVPGCDAIIIDVKELSESVRERALVHGIIQTIGDAAALSYAQPDGSVRRPTMEEKHAEMVARARVLMSGVWSEARVAGAGGDPYTSMVTEAVCNVTGKSAEEVREFMAALSADEKRALRNAPAVQKAMAVIRLERAGRKPDSDAGLGILNRFMAGVNGDAEVVAVKVKKGKK